jgi:superfamily II DNA or RNA helicase
VNLTEYRQMIEARAVKAPERGLKKIPDLCPGMFPHQRDCCEFLLGVGSGAAFLDTGLGKSLLSLEWGRVLAQHTNKPVLMFAPLAVGPQHVKEANRFDITAQQVRHGNELKSGINITNYEMLKHFKPEDIGAIVLDESSIIKSFTGQTTRALMQFAKDIPFRLACTATPAPNDHMELGQHAQFLGVMESSEMLMRWFIADQSEMGKYRIKKSGRKSFWEWMATWARCVSRPSDLGYPDDLFTLPNLRIRPHRISVDITHNSGDLLFRMPDMSATSLHEEKRITAPARAERIAELVAAESSEPWIIWCDTDYEAKELMARIPEAIEVRGSMSPEEKEAKLVAFTEGRERVLVTKPRIAGFGLNWQHCARVAFVGLSFSYEQFYQAVRRCYRFGQQREVHCHIAMAETEDAIWDTNQKKKLDHDMMKNEMAAAMRRAQTPLHDNHRKAQYKPMVLPSWMRKAI